MELASATWTEIEALETDLAVLPVGSTEQHGPHAPLGTDTIAAEAVATAGIERFSGEVVQAPTIPIGVAEEHRHFAGTMWVSADTFRAYVRESVASLAAHGFDRVVLVNGHGGNVPALGEVAATISRHDAAYAVPFTWFDAIETDEPMGHGGPLETAMVRHLEPDSIRADQLETARDGGADRWGAWVSGTNLAHDSAEFTKNGVVGDPTGAEEALGEQLLARSGEALATLLAAVAERTVR